MIAISCTLIIDECVGKVITVRKHKLIDRRRKGQHDRWRERKPARHLINMAITNIQEIAVCLQNTCTTAIE